MPETIDNRYELKEVIASGGMATVWRARDLRLDREVAVKRPHPASPEDSSRARLLREAKAAGALSHPNLVTVFDAGEDESGVYLVMELVDGPSLDQLSRKLSSSEIIIIGGQLGEALGAVHRGGIVHRDVKPANILMSARGAQLTDFGVALDSAATSRLTQPGTVYGTPSYVAPEVVEGQAPSPKSDVFALAVVVYELLAGHSPYINGDFNTEPPPLDDRKLDAHLRVALAADPDLRPDAEGFASGLRGSARTQAMVGGQGGATIPMSTAAAPTRVESEAARRRRGPIWGAAATVILLVVLAVAAATDDETPLNAGATTTTSTTTTTASSTTMPETTTTPEIGPTVAEARADLETVLEAISPSDLKPKDLRSMLDKTDDAINLVSEGDLDGASKKLQEVAKDVDKKLDGDDQVNAMNSLEQLAEALGIPLA